MSRPGGSHYHFELALPSGPECDPLPGAWPRFVAVAVTLRSASAATLAFAGALGGTILSGVTLAKAALHMLCVG
jgi:hypothetical protein